MLVSHEMFSQIERLEELCINVTADVWSRWVQCRPEDGHLDREGILEQICSEENLKRDLQLGAILAGLH